MVRYAELHCHSNFSFLDGASHPDTLADEAARLGLSALALTDHDGFYGIVRFAMAAAPHDLPTVFGAELTLDLSSPQNGIADPEGEHLVILADGPVGHSRLARIISEGQMAGEKGAPRYSLTQLAEASRAPVHLHPQPSRANDSWYVLTGCRKGPVPKALTDHGPAAAEHRLHQMIDVFGRDRVLVELWDHGDPLDRYRNDTLAELAARARVEVVATNNVHYATSNQRLLAAALAAVRARRSLDDIDGWLPASPLAHLRSPSEQSRRFARWPGAVEMAADVGAAAAFDLAMAAPNLPDYPVPPGHTEMTWLRELVRKGAGHRYPPDHPHHETALRQILHELDVIEHLDFPGYFLLVHDIVEFCNSRDIFCQGRGSAANSAVCYALGITKADAVSLGLLFERFLSPERDGPPDIDLDLENGRREEAIQYVYEKYGRDRAAQVANVITYRRRSSVREMAKACGLTEGQADALSKQIDVVEPGGDMGPKPFEGGPWGHLWPETPYSEIEGIPPLVAHLAHEVEHFPRHLGIHSGGMVMADRPLTEYCPIEWGRMDGRTVLQWDKDDCAAAGLVKFDLLGLGMLTAVHLTIDLIREHRGVDVDLAALPQEDAVYDMLCDADTVGVFQVESRAQMATLPRLKPRCFYDLVVEVALIRPGPIQGNSVHPYLARRNGEEPVTYLHPLLERSLEKTLGVPIFQEQLMQMAIDVAGFTPGESDQLRQAMGSKRSKRRMAALRDRLLSGMAERGITGEVADTIAHKLEAFAEFGFPESHSVSFAYLVYSSTWLKLHYPAEFLAGLLNAQPMGFYSPHTLVRDAMRHGVTVIGPDVNASRKDCTLTSLDDAATGHNLDETLPGHVDARPGVADGGAPLARGLHADEAPLAVRLGLRYVRNLGDRLLDRIEAERAGGPFTDMEDFVRRTAAPLDAVEALATAGAFKSSFGLGRREALWAAGAMRDASLDKLPGMVQGAEAPPLPGMTHEEETASDLWSVGIALGKHPTELVRSQLATAGVRSVEEARHVDHGTLIDVAGSVTHRQRPATAKGVVFLNLEDETGMLNVIVDPGVWRRYRRTARMHNGLVVRGVLERHQGVVNLIARHLTPVTGLVAALPARDFR